MKLGDRESSRKRSGSVFSLLTKQVVSRRCLFVLESGAKQQVMEGKLEGEAL